MPCSAAYSENAVRYCFSDFRIVHTPILESVMSFLRDLNRLNLCGIAPLSDTDISVVAHFAKQLTALDVSGI